MTFPNSIQAFTVTVIIISFLKVLIQSENHASDIEKTAGMCHIDSWMIRLGLKGCKYSAPLTEMHLKSVVWLKKYAKTKVQIQFNNPTKITVKKQKPRADF